MDKIILISNDFPPKVSGVADYLALLAEELSKSFSLVLLTSQTLVTLPAYLNNLVSVKRWDLFALFKILKIIQRESPQVVLLQYTTNMYGWTNFCLLFLMVILKIRKQKIILVGHELLLPGYPNWFGRMIKRHVNNFKDLMMVKASSGVIVTFGKRFEKLKEYKSVITQIPVGSNILPRVISQNELRAIKMEFNPKDELVIGYFGIPHEDKNYSLLLDVARTLEGVKFLIVGPEDRTLKRLVENSRIGGKIQFTGYLPAPILGSIFRIIDLYLNVDRRGISSRKCSLITVMAHKIPILSSIDSDFYDDIFIPGYHFYKVDLNPKQISDSISSFRLSKMKLLEIAENAYRLYLDFFTWPIIANKYKEFIEEVCLKKN